MNILTRPGRDAFRNPKKETIKAKQKSAIIFILFIISILLSSHAIAANAEFILHCNGMLTSTYTNSTPSIKQESKTFHIKNGMIGRIPIKINDLYITADLNYSENNNFADLNLISYFLLIDRYTGEVSEIIWNRVGSNKFYPVARAGDLVKDSFKGKCQLASKKF